MNWLLNKLLKPKTDSDLYWYYLKPLTFKGRWFGNLEFHAYAAIVFGVIALWPAGTFVFGRELAVCEKADWMFDFFRLNPLEWAKQHSGQFVLWAFFVTSSLPLFVWIEAERFEKWLKEEKPEDEKRKDVQAQRQWFETNAKHVQNFWKTIGSLFIGVGLLSLAKDKADSSDKVKIEALTIAVSSNTKAVEALQTKFNETVMALNQMKSANTQVKDSAVTNPATSGNATTPEPPATLTKE